MMKKVTAGLVMAAGVAEASTGRTKLKVLSDALASLNLGSMRSMVANPDDLSSACLEQVALSNVEIEKLFDYGDSYSDASFNISDFLSTLGVIQINVTEQQHLCGMDQYLQTWDAIMSDWPAFAGGAINLAMQIGLGFKEKD